MANGEKRDDFSWLLVLLEGDRRHRKTPFKTHESYYAGRNDSSLGYRFTDEGKAEREQEEMRKRISRANQRSVVYLIFIFAISLILTFLLH